MELDHPNILKVYQIYESHNSVYILMENLEGGSFVSLMAPGKNLPTKLEIISYMTCILNALKQTAKLDIMHRDIKAENFAFRKKDSKEIVLVDFGLASKCNIKDYVFICCGTPGASAPEVVNYSSKNPVKFTPKVDVFSAGVILFKLYPQILLILKSILDGLGNYLFKEKTATK
jgi:serine/threonine protein kinase